MNRQLTHNFNLDGTTSDVSLGILGDTRVTGLVRIPFHVLDDQSAVREYFLLPVDWQYAVVCGGI